MSDAGGASPSRRRDYLLTGLSVVAIIVAVAGSLGSRFGFANIFGHFGCDFYQLLADGFREGQLDLPLDGSDLAIFDSTPWRGHVYIHHGPLPAMVYALLDGAAALVGLGPPSKVFLMLVWASVNVLAVYFLLRRFVPTSRVVPTLLAISYGTTYPITNVLVYEVGASELASLYATTMVLLGLLAWLRYQDRPTLARAVLAGVLLGGAGLARPPVWAFGAALVAFAALWWRRRDAVAAAVTVFGGIGLFLLYNIARFGDPTNFADHNSYTGLWELSVDNHGSAPATIERTAVRALEALEGWFAFDPPDGGDSWTLYAISERGGQLLERGNLLLLGFFAGAFLWLRSIRKPRFELALLGAVAIILAFFVLDWQSVTARYVLDVWPALLVVSVAGLYQWSGSAQERWKSPWPPRVFVAIVLVSVAFTFAGRQARFIRSVLGMDRFPPVRSLLEEPIDPEMLHDANVEFCPGGILRAQQGKPTPVIECDMLARGPDDLPPQPWTEQDDLYRLGLHRRADGRCMMAFLSGATLWAEPGRACRIELVLEPGAVESCDRIELMLDGEPEGTLEDLGAHGSDELRCGHDLPVFEKGAIRPYFTFEDGVDAIREVSEERGFVRGEILRVFGKERGEKPTPVSAEQRGNMLSVRDVGGYYAFRTIGVRCDGDEAGSGGR